MASKITRIKSCTQIVHGFNPEEVDQVCYILRNIQQLSSYPVSESDLETQKK